MNNTVCKNFEYNEKADGILELISLNCDKCKFDGNCEIKTAYHNAKDYAEFHCGVEESGGHAYNCNDCPNKCEEWYQWDKEFKKKGDEDGN